MRNPNNEFGVSWTEWQRGVARLIRKRQYFKTAQERERFIAKLSESFQFEEVVAYCDPQLD